MKVAVALGTRPEIVKLAPVLRACRERGLEPLVLHTGQHYSFELDGVFFRELELPPPQVNLAVGSGTQAYQVAAILSGLAPVLERERPDALLVEGDTNSVLAAALAGLKSGVDVGHVEAGLRSRDRSMPEELNRILTDHLAHWLFAPTAGARANLLAEGISSERVHVTGNTVVDELLRQRERAQGGDVVARHGLVAGGYALATVHRAENVGDPARLRGIFAGLAEVARAERLTVLVALHPRTRARLAAEGLEPGPGLRELPPLGYLDFLGLHAAAALILTDSGGLQEEACCLGVPCVTLRDNTERPESVEVGASVLAGAVPERIVAAAHAMRSRRGGWANPFGDGRSGERIVDLLLAGRT